MPMEIACVPGRAVSKKLAFKDGTSLSAGCDGIASETLGIVDVATSDVYTNEHIVVASSAVAMASVLVAVATIDAVVRITCKLCTVASVQTFLSHGMRFCTSMSLSNVITV